MRALLWSSALLLVAACGTDNTVFGNGGGAAIGGAGGNVNPAGGAGGVPPNVDCESVSDCPAPQDLCSTAACNDGMCSTTLLPEGTSCGGDAVCSATGVCAVPDGGSCDGAGECLSGFCVDGVCCDAECDGDCEACDIGGIEGLCLNHDAGSDPETDCGPGVCDGSGDCAVGNHLWSKSYGIGDDQYLFRSAVDDQGNVLMTGYFYTSMSIAALPLLSIGGADAVMAKLDPNGTLLWSKRFGDGSSDFGWAVDTDSSGNVYAAGYFYGSIDLGGGVHISQGDRDLYLAKFDANGTYVWSKSFGDGAEQRTRSVAVDDNGNVVLGGWNGGNVSFGGATLAAVDGIDGFVARFDTDGNHLASRSLGGIGTEIVYAVAFDSKGDVLVSGNFTSSIDFGGGAETSVGGSDAFVAKLDPMLNTQWSRVYGDSSDQYARTVQADDDGNVVTTGYFEGMMAVGGSPVISSTGGFDAFVIKLDENGSVQWLLPLGNANNQLGQGAAVDSNGNVIVTGSNVGDVDFGGGMLTAGGFGVDAFLVKLSSDGVHVWSYLYGANGGQYGWSVNADANDDVVVTGYFGGSVSFGGATFTASSNDAFVAKFAK
jgi:hypothetical protein